jgi:hypothetical protein
MKSRAAVFGPDAPCAGRRPDFCARLGNLDPADHHRMSERLKTERQNPVAQTNGTSLQDALSACGLDVDTLYARQCLKAYLQENLDFVLKHCPAEAWSLARAQCERIPDTVSDRYHDFCELFYAGRARHEQPDRVVPLSSA